MDAWAEALGTLLTADQVAALIGSADTLASLERDEALIALPKRSGEVLYPAFQFADGAPMAVLAAAHRTLSRACSPWTAASWCIGPHPELAEETPRAWSAAHRDPARLLLVARRDAARLAT